MREFCVDAVFKQSTGIMAEKSHFFKLTENSLALPLPESQLSHSLMYVHQLKTQTWAIAPGIVSICLHTLQIIIKRECAVFFPSSLDLILGAYWHLHCYIDSLHFVCCLYVDRWAAE